MGAVAVAESVVVLAIAVLVALVVAWFVMHAAER
jgi:hypothetical protein